MDDFEIIEAAASMDGVNPESVIRSIGKAIQAGQCQSTRIGQSVFILIRLTPEEGIVHLFSIDTPVALGKSILAFRKRVLLSSLRKIYIHEESPNLIRLLRKLGFTLHIADQPKFDWVIYPQENLTN